MDGTKDGAGAPSDKVSARPCGVTALLRYGHRVWRNRVIKVWPQRVTSNFFNGMTAGPRGDIAQRAPQMVGTRGGMGGLRTR
jgi:hypothetical protein